MPNATGHLPTGGFNALVPEFDVFDMSVSLNFWCAGLGFRLAYGREGFAYLERERAQVMLNLMGGEWETGPLEYPLGGGINFEIGVSNIQPLLDSLNALNWPLYVQPRERWRVTGNQVSGNREFLVQDPNGYLLRFSEHLGHRTLGAAEG